MKIFPLFLLATFAVSGCTQSRAQVQIAGPDMATPLRSQNIDDAAFAEWEVTEKPISGPDASRQPAWVMWSENAPLGHSGFRFGDSKVPGARHLRIGFKAPVSVGTVVVRGGGTLSVLKAGATYPGALSDQTQWTSAQRLVAGVPSRAEVSGSELALWMLPPGTSTRAFRFSHTAKATDNDYAGWLGGALILRQRAINLAPLAQASTSAGNTAAPRLNDGEENQWSAWSNQDKSSEGTPSAPISARNAPLVVLSWPSKVKLNGLMVLWAGFSAADAQIYDGPAARHPRAAVESDWKTVENWSGLKTGYPNPLWPNRLDFGRTVETRAVRLRLTAPIDESQNHGHLAGNSVGGARAWLGELMALQPLENAPLAAVKLQAPVKALQPPIPVRFNLPKAGYVTLVIEGMSGKRIRNLVSETYFPAGPNVAWWDGSNDLGRDVDAAAHGLYKIPTQFVVPGTYRVRGLVRGAVGLNYEFSVYQEGNPPWNLPDHSGAWLSNHTPPQSALWVPASASPTGKEAVLLGSYQSEGTDGLAWVDLQGRKKGGKIWVGGIWTGAPYLARDVAPNPNPKIYAFAGAVWENKLRLTGLLPDGGERPVLKADAILPAATPAAAMLQINGLAAHGGVLVVSLGARNQILFVNTQTEQVTCHLQIPDPRGVAIDAAGRLFVLSGTKLLRFESAKTDAPQTLVGEGLEDPRGLALGANQIFVSDRGQSHQVKVFDPSGKLVRAIGRAGAPKAGKYDPLHLNNPDGLTLDSQNQLWVTENDYLPKRVSVWSLDGKLVRAFYGPSKYGGGGALDLNDSSRFYYAEEAHGTLEFKLDWQKGGSQLVSVPSRPTDKALKSFGGAAPETFFTHQGKRYATNCFNSWPTQGTGIAMIFVLKNGIARPVAAAGRANDWNALKTDAFKPFWLKGADLNGDIWQDGGKNQVFFLWSDFNDDSQPQSNEVAWQQGTSGGITVMPDLSFVAARLGGKAIQFAPNRFSATGTPFYNLKTAKV